MTLVVTHPYVSSIAESTSSGGAGGLVGPTEWNANHTLTGVASPAQGGTGITSGTGVTYFSSATVLADSGTLTANSVLVGGGANVAPKFDGNFTYGAAGGGVSIVLTSSTSTNAGLSIVTSSSSNMVSSASALNIAATWNNSGTTYDAPLFINVVNTASATFSLLTDWQVGGTTVAGLVKDGSWFSTNGIYQNATQSFNGTTLNGIQFFAGGGFLFYNANSSLAAFNISPGGGIGNAILAQGGYFGWTNSTNANGTVDTALYRQGAARTVAIIGPSSLSSANAFQVYNTTDTAGGTPTNYERGVFDWTTNANILTIGTQSGGTGTARNIYLSAGNTQIRFYLLAGGTLGALFNSNNSTLELTNGFFLGFESGVSGTPEVSLSEAAAGVLRIGTNAANTKGWMNWAGESRVSANSTTTSTALANVPGLAFVPQASRNYSFEAHLIFTDAAAGGIQCTVNATSTSTAIVTTLTFDGWVTDTTAVRGYAQGSAFGNVVASSQTTSTVAHVTITGTLMTSATAPSTVTIQFAQNTSNATPTTVLIGSYMWVHDMP